MEYFGSNPKGIASNLEAQFDAEDFLGSSMLFGSTGYVVFTVSYKDGWLLNAINPIPNLATTSAYPIDGSEKELIVYLQRFNLLLLGYSISGLTLIGIIIFYFKDRIIGTPIWSRRLG